MDPLQNAIWTHLGQMTDGAAASPATPVTPDAVAESPPLPASPSQPTADPTEHRGVEGNRRRFDRGGRRRVDWPEDAGMTCCPGCGFESLQSLGALDSGDYLWQCPQCDRRFQTGRATRALL